MASILPDEKEQEDDEFCDLILQQMTDQITYYKRLGSAGTASSRVLGPAKEYHSFLVRWNRNDFKRLLSQFDTELTRRLNSELRDFAQP